MKIVINRCYGGFGLSKEAYDYMGIPCKKCFCDWYPEDYPLEIERDNPKLVECVEKLGGKANGSFAKLVVVEIPDDVDWYIDDYDGMEMIKERHRSWY